MAHVVLLHRRLRDLRLPVRTERCPQVVILHTYFLIALLKGTQDIGNRKRSRMLRAHRHCSGTGEGEIRRQGNLSFSLLFLFFFFFFFFFLAKAPPVPVVSTSILVDEHVGERLKSALIGLSGSSVLALVCFSWVPGLRLPSEAGHRQQYQNSSSLLFFRRA